MGVASSKLKTKKWKHVCGSEEIVFQLMDPSDQASLRTAIEGFASTLPASDLVFLRMDITQPEAVDEWVENVKRGRTLTILAKFNGEIVGYANLHMSSLQWTSHIGEIRVLVSSKHRALGIGKQLILDALEVAEDKGLTRAVIHVPATQPRVRLMVESAGFEPEALLTDWLKDHTGHVHDLIIMSRLIGD